MAITQLNLSVNLSLNAAYDHLVLQDNTGNYNASTNPFGYGSPNGVAINNVTSLIVTLNYTTLSVSAVYAFTISSGTITAASITFNGGPTTLITSQLISTAWPFTSSNPFTFFNTYIASGPVTITLPVIEDGAYSVSYEIIGIATVSGVATNFDLTTTAMALQSVTTQCCLDEIWNKTDANCNCDDAKTQAAINAQTNLLIAGYAIKVQDSVNANLFLNEAKTICNCGCKTC